MLKRKNPLLERPPVAPGVAHRLGALAAADVQDHFAYIDENVEDLYSGVHVTPHPIVAAAYALPRRKLDYNDFGFKDVIDPPVLIGFALDGEEALDADGYVTAREIDRLATTLVEDGVSGEDLDDIDVSEEYALPDMCWGPDWYFDTYLGLVYAGGTFGNQPPYKEFLDAVALQMAEIRDGKLDNEDLSRNALRLAHEIIPQSRIMRDIGEDEVVAVVVLAPYLPSEDSPEYDEVSSPPFEGLEAFEGMGEPEEFDAQLLNDGEVVYGDPAKANRWHGTSLSVAAKALPGVFTPALAEEAREAGAAYDREELEAQLEEEEDDEY